MAIFMLKCFLLGIFFMMFVTPYTMCKGVWLLTYDEIDRSEKLKCMIPVYNMYLAETTYSGGIPTVFICTIVVIVVFLIRVVEVFFVSNAIVAGITIIILMLSLVVWYVLNAVLVFRVMHDADCNGLAMQIIYAIVFPIGQYYIGSFLPKLLNYALREEDTFGG